MLHDALAINRGIAITGLNVNSRVDRASPYQGIPIITSRNEPLSHKMDMKMPFSSVDLKSSNPTRGCSKAASHSIVKLIRPIGL
jgi:hypothetical protein